MSEDVKNNDENVPDENGKEHSKNYRPNWGMTSRFGSGQKQPSSEAKKAGHAKRKRNRELALALLGSKFIGQVQALNEKGMPIIDENGNPVLIDSMFKEHAIKYFGLTAERVENMTNEEAMMLRQIGQAIEKGDVLAGSKLFELAYGPPKLPSPLDDVDNKPVINITVISGTTADEPMPIAEDENPEENDKEQI